MTTTVSFNDHEPFAVYEWLIANTTHPVRIKLWDFVRGSSHTVWFTVKEGDPDLLKALSEAHKHAFGYSVNGMEIEFSNVTDLTLFKIWFG